MNKFRNITKEQCEEYIAQCKGLNQFNAIYKGYCLGYFKGNKLAGIIQYNPRIKANTTAVGLLHVKEEYRNKGIGSLLLAEIYKRMGTGKTLVLKADEEECLRNFYIKNGFKETDNWLFIKIK